jgi:hypothetical protein
MIFFLEFEHIYSEYKLIYYFKNIGTRCYHSSHKLDLFKVQIAPAL